MAGCSGTGSCYWVGGTGNASDTAHWATASGGATTGGLPTAADNVIFDTGSASDNYTFTVDSAMVCKDFTMGKPDGVGKKVTWAGTAALAISGSIALTGGTAGITKTYSGTITFNATSGTKTLNWNGLYNSTVTFNGAGATFQLASDMIGLSTWTLTAGTFDPSTYRLTGNTGGASLIGNFTLYDYTMVGSAATTRQQTFNGSITVTHSLTLTGNSATNRLLVLSGTIGTQRTITLGTGATISASNVDFKDIKLYDTDTSGADIDLSAITGLSGDCGGNDGIIFTDSDTMTWKDGDGGNWSDVGNWTKTAAAADRVPLPQDDVDLGIAFNVSQTVTANMPRLGRSIDWTGATGVPTWTTNVAASIFGSLTLVPATTDMILTASTQAYTFEGRAANMPVGGWTLTSAGNSWAKILIIDNYGGTLKLGDDIVSSLDITPKAGSIFDANDHNVTCANFKYAGTGGGTVYGGSGTFTITGYGTSAFYPSGTWVCETSTIKFTGSTNDAISLKGSGNNFYNVWFDRGASTGNINIVSSASYNQLKDTGTEAHSLIFTAGTTQTFTGSTFFEVNGSAGKLISLDSTTTATFALTKTSGGRASCDYLDIQHSVATPLNVWYAGTHSQNDQAVATAGSGWVFTAPPSDSTITTNRGRDRMKFTAVSLG